MNIDDIKNVEVPKGSLIRAIFEHQHELEVKYSPLEQHNGFYYPSLEILPHIDDATFQYWIKGFFWRVTEEIAEACETIGYTVEPLKDWRDWWDRDPSLRHFFEELADGLHFLVAVSIATKLPTQITDESWATIPDQARCQISHAKVRSMCFEIVYELGLAANTLKNKPWKNTQMHTDLKHFHKKLGDAWDRFNALWVACGFTRRDIYVLYCRKMLVNKFRQDSNY